MNELMENKDIIIAIVPTIIGSVLTYFGTKSKSKHDYQAKILQMRADAEAKQKEANSTTEGIYVQNMDVILKQYQEQVSEFRNEVAELKAENREIREQIKKIKDAHQKELSEYREYAEVLKTENKELREENEELKHEILVLKEER